MDLKQEKLDEMRQDMLIEQKLRTDYDYCLDMAMEKFGVTEETINKINKVLDEVNIYDWHIEFEDL